MANTREHDTLICLFHHTDRAERTVQELLEIGIPESAITLLGRARKTADIDTGTASLDTITVPDADRKRLAEGLEAGGSVVAVSTQSSMAGKIEAIFKEYSADLIDEKVMSTSDPETLHTGVNPPVVEVVEMASATDPRSAATLGSGRNAGGPVDKIMLVSKPATGLIGSSEIVVTEETLVLLEPTDLVEDTDLVEPRSGSSTATGMTDRFDPDAPIDNVRNPAADRLNDPLNRR